MYIDHEYIHQLLAQKVHDEEVCIALDKAERLEGLTHREVAMLLHTTNEEHLSRIFKIADHIKNQIYGKRIVVFAPLYVNDYCVNECTYCSYHYSNSFDRRILSMDEVQEEVRILENMGHKRIALEAGEDPQKCTIDYILECLKTIYEMKCENGEIRRVNVNIAATSIENYQKLKQAGIGTYILFQETYHQPTYQKFHLAGPKKNYDYHLNAFDRAMEAGVDDVGAGVLFGLYDPYFEVIALMLHHEHLEKKFGVGFHTISVPRLQKAADMELSDFDYLVKDETFLKLVAVLRLAVPYTGLILSTRENNLMKNQLLKVGVSQLSAGSAAEVGGYTKGENKNPQFEVSDERSAKEIIQSLMNDGYIPSFCTACYRSGRVGDRFMQLAKSGEIKNVCLPNALMTLLEYVSDYGDEEMMQQAEKIVQSELNHIEDLETRKMTQACIEKMKKGKRDLYL